MRIMKIFLHQLPGLFVFFLALSGGLCAQTTGAGYVSGIESKAREIKQLQQDMDNLKSQLAKLDADKLKSIRNAEESLRQATQRINNDASWKNRLQTARNGWEEFNPGTCSAGGPPPICPANHWFKSNVQDAMKRYNEYRDKFLKPYQEAIDRAKMSGESEKEAIRKEEQRKLDRIPILKNEMNELSRKYKEHIKEKAGELSTGYGKELVRSVAEVHFQESVIRKYQEQIEKSRNEEIENKAKAIEKVSREMEDLVKKLQSDILILEQEQQKRVTAIDDEIAVINKAIMELQAKIREQDTRLSQHKGTERERLAMEERRNELQTAVYAEQKKVAAAKSKLQDLNTQFTYEKDLLNKKVNSTRHGTYDAKQQAQQIVEATFKAKRELLQSSLTHAATLLEARKRAFQARENDLNKNYNNWAGRVDVECKRILVACQSVAASCYGAEVPGEANLVWNKTKSCIGNIEGIRNAGNVIYGCEELSAYYATLTGYLDGTGTAQNDIQQQTFKNRLDNIYN